MGWRIWTVGDCPQNVWALKHAVRLDVLAKAVDGTAEREDRKCDQRPRDDQLA